MIDTKELIRFLGFIHEYFENHADEQEPDAVMAAEAWNRRATPWA